MMVESTWTQTTLTETLDSSKSVYSCNILVTEKEKLNKKLKTKSLFVIFNKTHLRESAV